jgi:hypothetical protein
MQCRSLVPLLVAPGGCRGPTFHDEMEASAGSQFVGRDLHRRRTVLVRQHTRGMPRCIGFPGSALP